MKKLKAERIGRMHIVRFQGGFANQLFQLCFYYKLIEKYGKNNVKVDLSFYKENNDHGGYKLGEFVALDVCKKAPGEKIVIDDENIGDYKDFSNSRNYYYNGYWQDKKYFPNDMSFMNCIFNEELLGKRNLDYLTQIRKNNAISVHIRRGDYVDNFLHGNISNQEYIKNAVEYILKRITDPLWCVFSDDIPWCRDHFSVPRGKILFIEGNENAVHKDMYLMSCCGHNIISNSSFSWWAQELNKNPEKIVIAPEYWFNCSDKHGLNTDDAVHISNVPEFKQENDNPEFSIIIAAYNSGSFIRRCLSSALNQSFSNIEVIVVDDGSTDEGPGYLKKYAKRDKRLKVITKEKNESLLSARIAGMKMAKGGYILFLDSDDYMNTDACEVLHKYLMTKTVDITEFGYIKEPGKEVVISNDICNDDRNAAKTIAEKMLQWEYPHTVWNKCYSASLVSRLMKVAEDYYCNMSEDMYFSVLFFTLTKGYGRIDKVLYHYMDENGMSNTAGGYVGNIGGIVSSIKEKNDHLKVFLEQHCGDYLPLMKEATEHEIHNIASICKGSDRDVFDKIMALRRIDVEFDTDYSTEYESQHRWFDEFLNSGNKHRIALVAKQLKNKMIKKVFR